MKFKVFDLTGKQLEDMNVNKTVFETKINDVLMSQAVRVYLSNQRLASAHAKTRGEVDRTGAKVYRQKGTGNARHGDKKSPIFVGGGKAHGPKDQNYKLKISKKMIKAALKSALSLRAKEDKIIIVDGLDKVKEPKTKAFAGFFTKSLGKENIYKIALILNKEERINAPGKSAQNLDQVAVLNCDSLNTYEILKAKSLVLSSQALKDLEVRLTK
ncbi:50S ribosomal protein L4 [Candidatus Beckwithbacteria bacterium]|nr:50S ribosomal protein L4 [Candidatus Beckwithbacteria bacterium]